MKPNTITCLPTAPRLSELPGNKDLFNCANCGFFKPYLSRWLEHDHNDKPEPRCVVLCEDCAKKLIDPHPRLYRRLELHEPHPGAMPICMDCRWCKAMRCTSPKATFNGGAKPGLEYTYPLPTTGFACSRGKGCQVIRHFYGPVTACTGKEVAA